MFSKKTPRRALLLTFDTGMQSTGDNDVFLQQTRNNIARCETVREVKLYTVSTSGRKASKILYAPQTCHSPGRPH
jgi:hypothetical protein